MASVISIAIAEAINHVPNNLLSVFDKFFKAKNITIVTGFDDKVMGKQLEKS